MVSPKPVTLTAGLNPNPGLDPEPLIVVGTIPVATPTALTVVPAVFDDLAAVRTYLDTLVGEIKGSPYFS